jgi:hypothetical protein
MRLACVLIGALWLGTCPGLGAQESARKEQPLSAAPASAERGDDQKAIAGLVAMFSKAFNGGAAAAAISAEDAVVIDEHCELAHDLGPHERLKETLGDGVLTLAAHGAQQGALTGTVSSQDADHFTFRLVGGPPSEPGLSFAR